ncbi:MAG: outer membrane beta-barrel protein [Opitutales bacterium]
MGEYLGSPKTNKQTNKQTEYMKNKILATLVAFGLVGSVSAVEINENLSINGFIDASWSDLDTEKATGGINDNQSLGLDEIELNFLFNVGNVSGAIHIDDYDNTARGIPKMRSIDIEQAHFTYTLDNGISVTMGKYGSKLGFEREDPAGLFTYSRAYGTNANSGSVFNAGNVDSYVYEGVAVGYTGDVVSLNLSFHNGGDSNLEGDDLNTELSFSYTGIENLVLGGGFLFDNQGSDTATENDMVNVHAAYTTGKFLFAAEYSELDIDGPAVNDKLDAYMFLADYTVSDKMAVALRLSSNEVTSTLDYDKLTIAPRYSITESLGAILEFSDIDIGTEDANLVAVELTYTF